MAENYYVRIRGKVKGPYTHEKVLQQVRRKRLGRHHEISEDAVSWQKAGTFEEFFEPEEAAFNTEPLEERSEEIFEEIFDEEFSASLPAASSRVSHGGYDVHDQRAHGSHRDRQQSTKSRAVFVVLGLFLGGLGIHNFYAGYSTKGVIQLVLTLVLGILIIPLFAVGIWVLIEVITVREDSDGLPFT